MKLTLLMIAVIVTAPVALAQNMQIVGSNSMAKECYRASISAAMTGSASSRDVEICDKALSHGNMKRRDVIATYVNRGVVNMAAERFRDAARDYNRALDMNPDVAEAYVNRGNLWFMANRYAEAVADYDKSLELGFAQPHIALLNRGMVKEITGKLEAAKQDYLAALEKVEDWPVAQQKLERVSKKIETRDKVNRE